eukprot:scaffold29182_cov18-Tisochrysis_lutea.AAC.2
MEREVGVPVEQKEGWEAAEAQSLPPLDHWVVLEGELHCLNQAGWMTMPGSTARGRGMLSLLVLGKRTCEKKGDDLCWQTQP